MIFAKIKELCAERGISTNQLEKKANLSKGAISKWSTSSPTVDKLAAVADVLEVSLDELVGRKEAS